MPLSVRVLVLATVTVAGTNPSPGAAQTTQIARSATAVVHGTAIDSSGGVLPGVSVVASGTDRRVFATTITDEAGEYRFTAVPNGPLDLSFQIDGFATRVVRLTIRPNDDLEVVERLDLAPLTETVVVRGHAPVAPPRPSPPPPSVLVPVPEHDQESVCGPAKADAAPESFGTIRSRSREAEPGLYGKGDELIVDGGTVNGLEVGRNVVVRRHYRVSGPGDRRATLAGGTLLTGEHTSGLLQIVAAGERVSTAVVVYACDEIMKGDFLASFLPEPTRIPDLAGTPDYEGAARILFADAGQMLGVPRRLMVVDQGSDQSIRTGQRLTIFRRRKRGDRMPTTVGEAIVVAVRADSATIRVERVTDAIRFGDWAARQHPAHSAATISAGILPSPDSTDDRRGAP